MNEAQVSVLKLPRANLKAQTKNPGLGSLPLLLSLIPTSLGASMGILTGSWIPCSHIAQSALGHIVYNSLWAQIRRVSSVGLERIGTMTMTQSH